MQNKQTQKTESALTRLFDRVGALADYCWRGVWRDPRDSFGIRMLKTLNLSVRSFMDRDLQLRSMALTYSTVLAIVPALAMIFAIGRGFGLQGLVEDEIYGLFPAQKEAVATAFKFVDSYLNQASQGVFIGVGLVFLLWTLISLLSNIDEAFNNIWDIRSQRPFYQKITDYIAICLIVPVLLICSSGIAVFISTADDLHFKVLALLKNIAIEATPFVLAWLAFTFSYFLIPNTKVKFNYAAASGAVCAIAYEILQMLMLNGQIYVSRYNAIYGSFAFLPLLLVWLQFSWLILLFGCVLTYSMQNVFSFNYEGDVNNISDSYLRTICVALMAIVIRQFESHGAPLSRNDISIRYGIPIRIVSRVVDRLHSCGLVYFVIEHKGVIGIAPAVDNDHFTIADLYKTLYTTGEKDFIPGFAERYSGLIADARGTLEAAFKAMPDTLIRDVPLPEETE